jgi:hypothetical protein
VNGLLSKVKSFNALPLKAHAVRERLRKEIEKTAKSFGLKANEVNLKMRITDKNGKGVASRGTKVAAANDNKMFERAKRQGNDMDAQTLAFLQVMEGMKLTPQMANDLIGTRKDSVEYQTLVELGLIDENSIEGGALGEMADRQRGEGYTLTDEQYNDALKTALGIASMAQGKTAAGKKKNMREALKKAIIEHQKTLDKKYNKDEQTQKIDRQGEG